MTRSTMIAALVAASLPLPAFAQMMPGMKMGRPMPAVPKVKAKPAAKPRLPSPPRSPAKAGVQSHTAHTEAPPSPGEPSNTRPRPSSENDGGEQSMTIPSPAQPGDAPQDHAAHAMPDMSMSAAEHAAMPGMTMSSTPARYGEGSGTARNPGSGGAMHGLHVAAGDWMVMLHGYAWGIYTDQGGPRGDKEAFVTSMAMLSAQRDVGSARLQLRSMLSLEPLMGAKGYPNLFATGETADGTTQLIDRQHPHDLFMELSARLDVDAGSGSVFLYGGPVAEPALGPSAFMHRPSATYQPLSPITHHWFDSTHISYGVVTAGYASPRWQIEASAFRGREPDQFRWNIERPALDSWSVRATWTPSPAWALQISHGRLKSPEQLEAFRDEARTTASVQYASGGVSTLVAFSNKHKLPGRVLTAWLGEVNWDVDSHHTLFARAEDVANDELFPNPLDPLHDVRFRVGKLEGGYAYRVPQLGARYAQFVRIEESAVSVGVLQVNSYSFTVSGNVEKAGVYKEKNFVTALEAIALAGGPNKYAGTEAYIIRGTPTRKVPIDLKRASSGEHPEENVVVLRGDLIVVP